MLVLVPRVFGRLQVGDVDVGGVPVVPVRVLRVEVGDGGEVYFGAQRAIVEAGLVAVEVVPRLAVQVGDVVRFVAVAELRQLLAAGARLGAIGGRAHALLGNVGVARLAIGDAGAVLERVVRRAVGVVVVLVDRAARVLDARAPLEARAVVVLRAKRWWWCVRMRLVGGWSWLELV